MAAVFTFMAVTQLDVNCAINSQFSVCFFFLEISVLFINEKHQQI